MNAYFFNLTKEEKQNILDKHKHTYDGFVTQYVKPNQQPLYVQDFANDKNGITVSNKGNVTNYKNIGINESDFKPPVVGSEKNEDVMSGAKFEPEENIESYEMKEKFDMIGDGSDDLEHGTFDDFDDEDEISDYELYDECPECGGSGYYESDSEDSEGGHEDCYMCGGTGEYSQIDPSLLKGYYKEEIKPLKECVNKSLDMFRRFKNYY